MAAGQATQMIVGFFDAVFRPSKFVAAPNATGHRSLRASFGQLYSLLVMFVANVALYAGPLTLAGYGITATGPAPEWFVPVARVILGDPGTAWRLSLGFVQNSAFLAGLSGVTLLTYHGVVVLTFSSRGFIFTLHTIVYSTSAYLAGIFSMLVLLSETSAFATAQTLVVNIQIRFITIFYDLFAIPQTQRVFQPGAPVSTAELTSNETFVLAVLALLVLYFVYSLYLGTRLNHHTGPVNAVVSVIGVLLSPAVYVAALIVYSTGGIPL